MKDIGWGRDQTKKEKKIKVNTTFMPNEEKNFKVSGTFKMWKIIEKWGWTYLINGTTY